MNSEPEAPANGSPQAAVEAPAQQRPLRVVAIGGGTGLSTLLRGLRRYVAVPGVEAQAAPCLISDLAAVVSVTDDGGSSGRLREHFNMLPPGDLRNCMVALSEEEDLLAQLFGHRFRAGGALQGHNFGNLFVAALTEITGDLKLTGIEQRALQTQISRDCGVSSHASLQIRAQHRIYIEVVEMEVYGRGPVAPQMHIAIYIELRVPGL